MLTPYDDFPIHNSAEPIAHAATGDLNHYDRYWFNGYDVGSEYYFGVAMGHYPVRNVVDGAFSFVRNGEQHTIFASGTMPRDRATLVGPLRIEVVEPLRTLRVVVEPNEHGIECDLTFRATTAAIEEPRETARTPEGILLMDYNRLSQWGSWEGRIRIDGEEFLVEPGRVPGSRDRSWGVRPLGERMQLNRPIGPQQLFWLWAPLHFGDRFTLIALHEDAQGTRWKESAVILSRLAEGAQPWDAAEVRGGKNLRYDVQFVPGTRSVNKAVFTFDDPLEGEIKIDLEITPLAFRMYGLGYFHPTWRHGMNHGELEVARESFRHDEIDPADLSFVQIQHFVKATMGGRTGFGALEQTLFGPHKPTGLAGLLDGAPVG